MKKITGRSDPQGKFGAIWALPESTAQPAGASRSAGRSAQAGSQAPIFRLQETPGPGANLEPGVRGPMPRAPGGAPLGRWAQAARAAHAARLAEARQRLGHVAHRGAIPGGVSPKTQVPSTFAAQLSHEARPALAGPHARGERASVAWSPGGLSPANPIPVGNGPPTALVISADVRDYGAVGKPIIAKGGTAGGSLLILLGDPGPTAGWTFADLVPRGGQIGFGLVPAYGDWAPYRLRGTADPSGFIRITPDESKALKDAWQLIEGDWLAVTVFIDDAPAIQDALNDAANNPGSEVFIPRGTYTLGVPSPVRLDRNNQPLFVPSQTTVRGDGMGETVLRLADEVEQWLGHNHVSNIDVAGAAVFVNANSLTIAYLQPSHPKLLGALPKEDHDIWIRDLTIDGNKDGQSRYFTPGGDPSLWRADPSWPERPPSSWPRVDPGNPTFRYDVSSDFDAMKPTALPHRARWGVAVTLFDVARNKESPSCPPLVIDNRIDKKGNFIGNERIILPPQLAPPRHSYKVNVYIKDLDACAKTNRNTEMDPDCYTLLGQYDYATTLALANNPTPAKDHLPPGLGPTSASLGGGGAATGILLDNISSCHIESVEIRNSGAWGLLLGNSLYSGGGVRNSDFSELYIHDNCFQGIGATNAGSGLMFAGCIINDNSGGFDWEPNSPPAEQSVAFRGCHFSGRHDIDKGLQFAPASAAASLLVEDCTFEGFLLQILVGNGAAKPGWTSVVRITGCTFADSLRSAILISGPWKEGCINDCTFQDNSAPKGGPLWFMSGPIGSDIAPAIYFQTMLDPWHPAPRPALPMPTDPAGFWQIFDNAFNLPTFAPLEFWAPKRPAVLLDAFVKNVAVYRNRPISSDSPCYLVEIKRGTAADVVPASPPESRGLTVMMNSKNPVDGSDAEVYVVDPDAKTPPLAYSFSANAKTSPYWRDMFMLQPCPLP